MKILSKQTLILGGIYALLELPLLFVQNTLTSTISGIALILFLILLIGILFNKSPKFMSAIMAKYPRLNTYLTFIGWIPYSVFLIVILLIGSGYFVEYSKDTLDNIIIGLQYLIWAFYALGFIIATTKIMRNN